MIQAHKQDVTKKFLRLLSISFTVLIFNSFFYIPCLANSEENYRQYYTIAEENSNQPMNSKNLFIKNANGSTRFFNSFDLNNFAPAIKEQVVSLLKWLRHDSEPPTPSEKYNRKDHFGRWLRDPFDNTCLDTRGKVLARDSAEPVKLKENNHCIVEKGLWYDPYSGEKITEAKDVQIDHFVPLKNAYISGAWTWNFAKRCLYANYMSNEFHLIAVSGTENMKKSDRTPANYLPPNNQFVCSYLDNWLKVKLIWNLTMLPPETEAIKTTMKKLGCSVNSYVMDEQELTNERINILQGLQACELQEKRLNEKKRLADQKQSEGSLNQTTHSIPYTNDDADSSYSDFNSEEI